MEVYRLAREKFARPLSGKGAALKGARWNSIVVELIYAAMNRSLAMAEVPVHFTIASFLCDEIHGLLPDIITRVVGTEKRGENVYLDARQNDYADTLAVAYCVRPYHQPLISTPLEWREVKSSLDRWAFLMDTIEKRVEKKGDLWKGIMEYKFPSI